MVAPPAGGGQPESRLGGTLATRLAKLMSRLGRISLNLKTINRFLAVVAVITCAYLTWDLTAGQTSYEKLTKEIERNQLTAAFSDPEILHKDDIDYKRLLDPDPKNPNDRNIFEPVPKPKPTIEPPPQLVTQTNTGANVNIPPPPPTDPIIQQIRELYKVVAIFEDKTVVSGKEQMLFKATIEDNKEPPQAWILWTGKGEIKGTLNVSGGDFKYTLKVVTIKGDTVTLAIEEYPQKLIELNLSK